MRRTHFAALALSLGLAACAGPKTPASTGTDAAQSPTPGPAADVATPAAAPAQPKAEPAPPEAEPTPPDPLAPLAAELQKNFENIEFDPRPEELTRNSHYWISNEHSQYLWREHIEGLGGAYVGVGTDQTYLLAGWAKSEFIVPMDFDRGVKNLHRVYGMLFRASKTPDELIEWFAEDKADEVQRMIEKEFADAADLDRVKLAHKISRKLVERRLIRVRKQYSEADIPTFLTDQGQYDHIRTLWQNGRVVPTRGDLTGDKTMVQIANALKAAGIELNVLYLSNAEQYFEFVPTYRRNIAVQPLGEKSQVLRTLGWSLHGFVEGEEYHYNIQGGRDFATWMKTKRIKNAGQMLTKKTDTDTLGLSVLDFVPKPSKKPPELAP